MSKILIHLSVPAVSSEYDIWVPDFLRIRVVSALLAESVENLTSQRYTVSKDECLCCRELRRTLDETQTLKEAAVKNGYHLILI